MIYIEMSDFEINCAVAKALGLEDSMFFSAESDYCNGPVWTIESGVTKGGIKASKGNSFDPCNSWADAGPIIHHELINIGFDDDGYQIPESGWSYAKSPCGKQFYGKLNSPLRTAMIVFLMMKEADNG